MSIQAFRAAALAALIGAAAGCAASPKVQTTEEALAKRFEIAAGVPGAYGDIPCADWAVLAERSMLGFQQGRSPTAVMADLPRSFTTPFFMPPNFQTANSVRGNVLRMGGVIGPLDQRRVAMRYGDLVAQECLAIRAS